MTAHRTLHTPEGRPTLFRFLLARCCGDVRDGTEPWMWPHLHAEGIEHP